MTKDGRIALAEDSLTEFLRDAVSTSACGVHSPWSSRVAASSVSVPMIYEHTTQKRHFVIEWARPNAWGEDQQGKWMASCNGSQLVAASHPQAVLAALVSGDCLPALDGTNPSDLGLPQHLDGWATSRT